jgi:magnesium transporter
MNVRKKHAPPKSLIYTGNQKVETTIRTVTYSLNDMSVLEGHNAEMDQQQWVQVIGLTNEAKISQLCQEYRIDPLIVEDIFNVNQRSKIEWKEDTLFSVIKSARVDARKEEIIHEVNHDYISFVLQGTTLITFHETDDQLYDVLFERLKDSQSFVRKHSVDYLFYRMFDTLIDNATEVEQEISMTTNQLEERILALKKADQAILYQARKELIYLKSAIDPITKVFTKRFYDHEIFADETQELFLDLEDHIMRLSDNIVSEKEALRNLLDLHMNNVSYHMNNIMKTLTIFSAIFIPLSFLAGVFGMNFVHFEVLSNPNGLLFFVFLCIGLAIAMLGYFKWKKWY